MYEYFVLKRQQRKDEHQSGESVRVLIEDNRRRGATKNTLVTWIFISEQSIDRVAGIVINVP